MLARKLRTISGSGFLADVAKLSVGTLSARLIAIIALPVLTRLYSPEDFAVLATYLAILGIVSVVACLRLDIAIPLAETDEDGVNLLALALSALALLTLIMTLLTTAISDRLAVWIGIPDIKPYLWLVPIGIALAGTYSAFQYWATRMKRFGHVARTRVTQSLLGTATMLSMGWLAITPLGLLLGNAFSFGAGGFGLALGSLRNEAALLRQITVSKMMGVMRRYKRYPLFSTPEALLNVAGQQVPVLIIAATAGTEAGFLMLAMQLMTIPMSLLGSSISQVYMSRAPGALRDGRLPELTHSIMRRLALIGVPSLLIVGFLAPSLVPYIFGAEWARTGVIIAWMIPWIALQFITSPVSMVLYVVGRQRAMLVLTTLGFVVRVGSVLLALHLVVSPVAGFAIGSAIFYVLLLSFVLSAAGGTQLRQLMAVGTTYLNPWVLIPVALTLTITAFLFLNP